MNTCFCESIAVLILRHSVMLDYHFLSKCANVLFDNLLYREFYECTNLNYIEF